MRKWQISQSLLLEYIDCPWFIDFLLQEVAQLSANREKCVSAICFGTLEADNFSIQCMWGYSFLCVSAGVSLHHRFLYKRYSMLYTGETEPHPQTSHTLYFKEAYTTMSAKILLTFNLSRVSWGQWWLLWPHDCSLPSSVNSGILSVISRCPHFHILRSFSLTRLVLERGRSRHISPSVSQEPEIPARDAIWYKSIIMKVQHGAKWVSTSAARGANDKTASLCSLACR